MFVASHEMLCPNHFETRRHGHFAAFCARLDESSFLGEGNTAKLPSMRNQFPNIRNSLISFSTSMLFAVMSLNSATGAQAQKGVEPHTAAAVIADDEGWSKAEKTGDINYINALLLPEYRSISSDGSTHDKAAILAHAAKGRDDQSTAKAEQWRAAHPYKTSVEINGDMAILTFALDKGVELKPIMSCDIFVYREGHWHALYSQHTEAGK